jgi:hypothetical protein
MHFHDGARLKKGNSRQLYRTGCRRLDTLWLWIEKLARMPARTNRELEEPRFAAMQFAVTVGNASEASVAKEKAREVKANRLI